MTAARPHQPADRTTPGYDISTAHTADACTVTMTGELDMASRAEMENTLFDGIANAPDRKLVIDMAAVTFLDSAAISALVAAYHRAGQNDVSIAITRPSRQVARVLQITGLLDLFTDGAPVHPAAG